MSHQPSTTHARGGNELWWAWLIALAGAVTLIAAALSAGALELGALLIHGCTVPLDGLAAALSPYAHPGVPSAGLGGCAPSAGPYWALVGAECLVLLAVAVALASLALGMRAPAGFANAAKARRLGAVAQRRRSAQLRPALTAQERRHVPIGALAVSLGRCGRRRLYGSLEDVYLIVGGIRRGKTGLLSEAIADWQGPVLLTTTKPGDLEGLLGLLGDSGRRVLLFDPSCLSPWPERAWWNPVAGCLEPRTAAARANAMMAPVRRASRVEGVDWGLLAELLLTCLLHAAAIDDLDMATVFAWSQSASVAEAAERLERSPFAPHWRRTVELQAGSAPETWASIQINLQTALAAVRQPSIMRWLCPEPEQPQIDPDSVVGGGDALVVLGGDAAQATMAPITAALADAVIEAALARARRSARGRLDPPLLLALDEMPKVAPLPTLPRLASEGSSQGVVPFMVAQDPGQLREAFGDNVADSLWTCASVRVVFGGITNLRDREQLSALSREIEVDERPRQRLGARPQESVRRRVRALTVDAVHAIPAEQAVMLASGLDPIRVHVPGPQHRRSRLHRRWRNAREHFMDTTGTRR